MIHEDASAPCHLPREVIDKEYASSPKSPVGQVRDLYEGAMQQMHEDEGDLKKAFKAGKY